MNGAPDADFAVFTEALRLPPEERDRYLDGACKGNIEVRRRVEPSNILVTQSQEGVATPMVFDFGVAKATTNQRLRLGLNDAARASLSHGNKLVPELSSIGAVDLGDGWLDWLIARILLDEATQLVTAGSTPAENSRTQ